MTVFIAGSISIKRLTKAATERQPSVFRETVVGVPA